MKIGICGLGMMGRAHLANALKIEGLDVVALCDSDPEKLDLSKPAMGNIAFDDVRPSADRLPRFTDFGDMLAQAGSDAVVIAVPTHFHADLAVAALEAGLHVFCEKPMALSVDDAERMCRAARHAGRTLSIGHVVRFFPAYHEIFELIRTRKHGRVVAAEFSRVCGLPGWGSANWFADPARSGGMPVDLHIHDTDFILYALGTPPALQAFRSRDEESGVDVIRSMFLYPDAIVSSYGAWLQKSAGFSAWASVTFERATVFFHTDRGRLELYPEDGDRQEIELPDADGYEAELREFVRCAESGRPVQIATPESALETLRLVHLELQSAHLGSPAATSKH